MKTIEAKTQVKILQKQIQKINLEIESLKKEKIPFLKNELLPIAQKLRSKIIETRDKTVSKNS